MVKIRRKDKTFFQFITPNAPLLAGRGAGWQKMAYFNVKISLSNRDANLLKFTP